MIWRTFWVVGVALVLSACGPATEPKSGDGDEIPVIDDEGENSQDGPQNNTGNGGDETRFANDLNQALGGLEGMVYQCYAAAEDYTYVVEMLPDTQIQVSDGDNNTAPGSYDTSSGHVRLSVPNLAFDETSTEEYVELDALVLFVTPSLRCHAVRLTLDPAARTNGWKCPSINYIPETSYEKSEFFLDTNGTARWRHWTELTRINDTLYSDRYGVHRTIGDRVYMAFANRSNANEQFLTATITATGGLLVDQLEPERGECEPL